MGLTTGTQYYYKVGAVNAGGESSTATVISNYTRAAVTSLTVSTISVSELKLDWTVSGTATSYKISRSDTLLSGYSQIATCSARSFTDSGLLASKCYYYKVVAVNNGGDSDDSSPGSGATSSPTVSFLSASQSIGESAGSVTITATLSAVPGTTVTVNCVPADITAHAGTDYEEGAELFTFLPNNNSAEISIPILPDNTYETTETFQVSLQNPTSITLGGLTTETISIIDDDLPPTISLTPSSQTVGESSGTVTVIASINEAPGLPASVNFSTIVGTASSPDDFTSSSGTITFNSGGVTTQSISISITSDTVHEANETFTVEIKDLQNARISESNNSQTITIIDDDPVPLVGVSPAARGAYESVGQVEVNVFLSSASEEAATIYYTTENGTALGGLTTDLARDYTTTQGVISLAPRQTSSTIYLNVNDDDIYEKSEWFNFSLTSASLATITTTTQVITIEDNDASPTVSLTASTLNVFEGGTAYIGITLSHVSGTTATINYSTVDGTAFGGRDYTPVSGVCVILPGNLTTSVTVPVIADSLYEQNEAFSFHISNPSECGLGSITEQIITIPKNGTPPIVSFSGNKEVKESCGTASLEVSLCAESGTTATVPFTVNARSVAIGEGVDYTITTPSPLVFAPGMTTSSIVIAVINDRSIEKDETIIMDLVNPTSASLNSTQASVILTILDDDSGLVSFDLYPQGDSIVGLSEVLNLKAIGRNGVGNEVAANPVWTLKGPGRIAQTGRYVSPSEGSNNEAEIVVSDSNFPEIQASKKIIIDSVPPQVIDLRLDPRTEPTTGTVNVSWNLAAQPSEQSLPVMFSVLLDEGLEIARFSSATSGSLQSVFEIPWNSAVVTSGTHTIKVVAWDARANSNIQTAPEISFRVAGGNGGTGVDWLLVHQWRENDDDIGSWKSSVGSRSLTELITEASFAANTLATEDLTHRARSANIYSGECITVAQSYHDAIAWLGKQVTLGHVQDFALRGMVMESLALASARRGRIINSLGYVSNDFEDAIKIVDHFISKDADLSFLSSSSANSASGGLLAKAFSQGGFATGEESLSTRYETLLALRVARAAGRSDVISNLLSSTNYFTSDVSWRGGSTQTNVGGWTDVSRGALVLKNPDFGYLPYGGQNSLLAPFNLNNYYLSAETASSFQELKQDTGYSELDSVIGDTKLSDLLTTPIGASGKEHVTDAAAGIQAMVLGRMGGGLNSNATTHAITTRVDYLSGEQSMENGSWNNQALDTAWATRVLRPEFTISLPSDSLSYLSRSFKVNVSNVGTINGNARVSLFTENPASMLSSERVNRRKSVSDMVRVSTETMQSITIPMPDGAVPTRLYFMVDAEEKVPEFDDNNNIANWALPQQANLVVASEGIRAIGPGGGQPFAGTTWTLEVDIWNLGQRSVPLNPNAMGEAPKLALYRGHPWNPGSRALPYEFLNAKGKSVLSPGEKMTVVFSMAWPEFMQPGVLDLYAYVDPDSGMSGSTGVVDEAIETDNIASHPVRIYDANYPEFSNLVIHRDGLDYGDKPLFSEAAGWLKVRVDNPSHNAARNFDVAVYCDGIKSPSSRTVGVLEPGRSISLDFPLTLSAATSHTVTAIADASNSVIETNENDNSSSITVVVYSNQDTSGTGDLGIARDDISLATSTTHFIRGDIREVRDTISTNSLTLWAHLKNMGNYTTDDTNYSVQGFPLRVDGTAATAPTSGPVTVEVSFDAVDNEYSSANNSATRDFFLSKTNLRVLDVRINPFAPPIISAGSTTSLVNVFIDVANGDAISSGIVQANNVHLQLVDDITGKEIGYWNNLNLTPMAIVDGTTQGIVTVMMENVPFTAGLHVLHATVDPIGYFIETDEDDNSKILGFRIDDKCSRMDPDPKVSEQDIRSSEAGNRLTVSANITNQSTETAKCAAAENVAIQFYKDSATTENLISWTPAIIRELQPGENFVVTMPTSLSLSSITSTTRVVVVIDSEKDRDMSNNQASRLAAAPNSPSEFKASMDVAQCALTWQEPNGLVEAVGYRLERYRTGAEAAEFIWGLPDGTTSFSDSEGLISDQDYTYKIWSLGSNGRTSAPPAAVTAHSNPQPHITSIITANNRVTTMTTNMLDLVALSPSDFPATVTGTYQGSSNLALFRYDGKTTAILGVISPTSNTFSFSFNYGSYNETYSELQVAGYTSSSMSLGCKTTIGSNRVAIYYDVLPDLTFQRNSSNEPMVELWGKSGEDYIKLNEIGEMNMVAGQAVFPRVYIKNNGSAATGQFDILIKITYEGGKTVEKNQIVQNGLDGNTNTCFQFDTINLLQGVIQSLYVKIDYDKKNGVEVPYGKVLERSETNNSAFFFPSKGDECKGTEFWFPIPFLLESSYPMDVTLKSHPTIGRPPTIYFRRLINGALTTWTLNSYSPASAVLYDGQAVNWRFPNYSSYYSETDFDSKEDKIYNDKCFIIQSSNGMPFSAQFICNSASAQGGFLIFSKDQLGTRYVVPGLSVPKTFSNIPTWFQIMAVEDGSTTVCITPNYMGYPRYFVNTPNFIKGKKVVLSGKDQWQIVLKKGETYVWRGSGLGQDPTGAVIDGRGRKIAVLSGRLSLIPTPNTWGYYDNNLTMVPPIDKLGKEHVLPNLPEGNGNRYSRIIATEMDPSIETHVTIFPEGTTYTLSGGRWIDVGIDNFEDTATTKIIDNMNRDRRIVADYPVLVYEYYSCQSVTGRGCVYLQKLDDSEGGDPDFVWDVPVESYNDDEYIPVALNAPNAPIGHDKRQDFPYQWLTIIAKVEPGMSTSTDFNWPPIEVTGNAPKIDQSTGWLPFDTGADPSHSYRIWKVQVEKDRIPGYFRIHNIDRVPMNIRLHGFGYCKTFALPVTYKNTNVNNVLLDSIDLAVSEARFPYRENKLSVGEKTLAQVEVTNKGTSDVLSSNPARLSIFEVVNGGRQLITSATIPSGGTTITAKLAMPYVFSFDYTPRAGVSAIYTTVTHQNEGNWSDNAATRTISSQMLVSRNLKIDSVEFDPPSFSPPPGLKLGQKVSMRIKATCMGIPVDEVPIKIRIYPLTLGAMENNPRILPILLNNSCFNFSFNPSSYAGWEYTDQKAIFTPASIKPVTGGGYQAETTVNFDQWTAPYPYSWYFGVEVTINPDNTENTVSEGPDNKGDNFFSSYYWLSRYTGNLRINNASATPEPVVVGQTVNLTGKVYSDTLGAYSPVSVKAYIGDPRNGTGMEVARTEIASMGVSSTADVALSFQLNEPGDAVVYLGVNPEYTRGGTAEHNAVESRYDDNWTSVVVKGISGMLPDLTRSQASHFALPTTVTRGVTVNLSATVTNIGYTTASAHKVAIVDGSPNWDTNHVLADEIFPSLAADTSGTLTDTWNTSEAALGDHEVFLVIDSPNHLAAAPSEYASVASKTPLSEQQMTAGDGIVVANTPDSGTSRSWQVEVYATNATTFSLAQRIGIWNTGSGYRNVDSLSSLSKPAWISPGRAPVLLVFSTLDGGEFPKFDSASVMSLSFRDDLATGTMGRTVLDVHLPANDKGQWKGANGTPICFWLADDGSTYFSRQLHLSNDFPVVSAGGSLPLDMTADKAMNDMTGSVAELFESNNVFKQTVQIESESGPNLTISALDVLTTPTLVGNSIDFDVAVKNTGVDLTTSVFVALTRQQTMSQGTPTSIGQNSIIGGIGHNETKTLRFRWQPNLLVGDYVIAAKADANNRIAETNESDNLTSTLVHIDGTTTLTVSEINPTSYGVGQPVTLTATVASSELSSAVLCLDVYRVGSASPIERLDLGNGIPFSLTGESAFAANWNTGRNLAGSYFVRATLKRLVGGSEQDSAMTVDSSIFTIEAQKNIDSSIRRYQSIYNTGDPITFTGIVRNKSLNYDFPELKIAARILNHADKTLWEGRTQVCRNVNMGAMREVSFTWFNPMPFDNQLRIRLTAFEDTGAGTHSGNGIPDPDEPQATVYDSFVYGTEIQMGGSVDIVDPNGGAILYTSMTQVALNLDTFGGDDMTTSGLMMLSDNPLTGPGILVRNYMPNGGFESNQPTSLTWHETAVGGLTSLSRTSSISWAGSQSLLISGEGGSWAATKGGVENLAEEGIVITPSTDLTVSFRHRVGSEDDGLLLTIYERDGENNVIRTFNNLSIYSSAGAWGRGELHFITDPSAHSIGIHFALATPSSSMTGYVDNIQIEEGTVATTWIDPVGYGSVLGHSVNLLANPSLTIDNGINWAALYPALDTNSNAIAFDGIPNAWTVQGASGQSISTSTLPEVLTEHGLNTALNVASNGSTVTVHQGKIPVESGKAIVFSVYANGQGNVSLRLLQYDRGGNAIDSATTTTSHSLTGNQFQRLSMPCMIDSNAGSVAVEITVLSSGNVSLAAAQLEPETTPDTWVGWTPYHDSVTSWSIKSLETNGEKRVEAQYLDPSGRLSRRPSRRISLLSEPTVSFSATAQTDSGDQYFDPSALVDGDQATAIIKEAVSMRTDIDISTRPMVSNVVISFGDDTAEGSTVRIEGGFEPDEWNLITSASLTLDENNEFELPGLNAQYSHYRVTLESTATLRYNITEISFRGWFFDGSDNVVYDTGAPDVTVNAPDAGQLLGIGKVSLTLTAEDNISGIRSVSYSVIQGASGGTTETKIGWTEMGARRRWPLSGNARPHATPFH